MLLLLLLLLLLLGKSSGVREARGAVDVLAQKFQKRLPRLFLAVLFLGDSVAGGGPT